jgi:hypothetical protein
LTGGAEGRDQVTIRIEYEANLRARRLVRRASGAKPAPPLRPISPNERRLALAAGHQFDFRSESFQSWLDAREMRRGPNEGEIDFARRAFLYLKREFQHIEGAELDRLASQFWVSGSGSLDDFKLLATSIIQADSLDLSQPFPKPATSRATKTKK